MQASCGATFTAFAGDSDVAAPCDEPLGRLVAAAYPTAVSSGGELQRAIQRGVAHVLVTEHLDLRVEASPSEDVETDTTLGIAVATLSIRVRAGWLGYMHSKNTPPRELGG